MPSPDTAQALVAVFAFGNIFNAATASLFQLIKDHGWQSFRDGPRLVLIVFLVGAALWAQVDFIAIMMDGSAMPSCQIATSFASAFDQIARVSLLQFLLWVTQNGNKTTAQTLLFQGFVFVRFLLGGVVVGVARPQFGSEFCVSTSLVMPLSIAVIVTDCAMAFFLLVKVFTQGSFKAVTEVSAPMLLGYESMPLITRTFFPAIGLGIVLGDSGYSTDNYAPPNRYEEIKGETVVSINAFGQNPRPVRAYNQTKAPSLSQIGRPHLQQGPDGISFDAQSTFAPSRQAPAPNQGQKDSKVQRSLSKKGGKIQISAPVLVAHAETGQNPLDRIATIDLATAARHEKERRELPAQPLASNLLAGHYGSKGPLSPNSMMKNPGSVKRKQIAPSTSDQSVTAEPLLDPAEMVTTTSSQLSPGVEELRRRSPRHAPEGPLSNNGASSPRVPAKSPARRSQHVMSALTASDSKTRPSSTLPLTPPPKSPKRPQPPLSPFGRAIDSEAQTSTLSVERGTVKVVIKPTPKAGNLESPPVPPKDTVAATVRPMNGLPRNPRMAAAKRFIPQQKTPKEQTVMLIKDIEYDDPDTVRDIVQGAATKPAAKRVASVVNRPRPIPRQSTLDRQIFPAEGSPSPNSRHAHKRSLSGGSAISRKSILQSRPTSPSQLPPLPPVPQTAGQPGRPLPNNTRSMTFDEKMVIFYPDASAGDQPVKEMRRRSSSVPELPELPAAFRERSRSRSQSRDLRDSIHHTDKSSRSSIRTASLLDFPEVPTQHPKVPPVSKFSVDTTVGEGMIWAMSTKAKFDGYKRQSSPVLPAEALRSPSNGSELKSHDDDTTTLWGSIHSPVKCTVIQKAMAVEVPPVPKIRPCPKTEDEAEKRTTKDASERGHESHVLMTVVLDTSNQGSPFSKPPSSEAVERVLEADPRPVSWHRRIGDECPMFSGRQDSVKRRKNPPPAPLPLNRTTDRRPRLVPAPEPSPLEAPEQALRAIQEQLRKFEDPNRDSTGSQQLQRMTLLANLEAEMGMHENQWQKMQSRLDRDSFSTTAGSPRKRESRPDSLAVSIVAQADDHSQRPERRTSRPSIRLSKNKRTASIASSRSNSSLDNEHEWDEDLAEAQAEYLKHRFQLVSHLSERTTSMLVASPKKASQPELPITSSSPDERVSEQTTVKLWQPSKSQSSTFTDSTPSLWIGVPSSVNASFPIAQQPETLRRTLNRAFEPLAVESDRLWEKKQKRGSFGPQKGLWASKQVVRPISTTSVSDMKPQPGPAPSKTLARKPSRRSKRVTLLPDILENPEPMPDKRGTLAIYQFPWGEKSDSASIRPRPQMLMAMPGTMTSGRSTQQPLQQQQQQLVPQLTNPFAFDADNYSASYFDDEDEGDNFPEAQALSDEEDRYDEQEDDSDDFDETTLWEIASLLKSNQVPSRQSLLPEDWRLHVESSQVNYSDPAKISQGGSNRSAFEQDVVPDAQSDASSLYEEETEASPALWTGQKTYAPNNGSITLPNPEEQEWHEYAATMPAPVRAPTRSAQPDTVSSESLWMAEPETTIPVNDDSMWQPKMAEHVVAALWTPKPQVNETPKGLDNPTEETWAAYQIDLTNVVRAATRSSGPSTIESTSLWQANNSVPVAGNLWVQQTSVPQQPKGVANPSRDSWAVYNVNMKDTVRAPTRPSQTSTIESDSMWRLTSSVKQASADGLWMSQAFKSPPTQLWSAPAPEKLQPATGLAQPSTPSWANYTATGLSPVRAKPRLENVVDLTLELTSSDLWGAAHASPVREDWISLSTVRARSPSTSSVESAASDASSIKSTTTKASTVGSIFSAFWRRKRGVSDATTEESVPEVPEVPVLPIVEETQPEPAVVQIAEQPAAKAPSALPLRRQYRPNIAFRADWDAALQEAILASNPSPPRLSRPTVQPSDWADALAAALAQHSSSFQEASPTTQLWTSAPLKSPLPTTASLWVSHLSRAPRAAFPADCSVLPTPSRRGRSGSLLQDGVVSSADAGLEVPEGLTEQSLWRRSVAMQKAEARTRDWLVGGSD
ncbi:hypothetical protein NLU13_7717 [Sarocladium strictum]|uniref:Uncharacterized protein n=1 Tax=Sarocladium strictum TaxID=5046 RepID=A0AA39GDW3_SARSR|nr:hypothetical protein NLU13_7717 [Sarocladium strictum]